MDRNVHADLPFSEDAFIDADIVGAINIDPTKEVFYNTTEYWDSHPEIIAAKGIIYIYSDYKIIDGKTIPGIKVGDGSSYLIDIPFSDIETEVEVTPVVTEGETLATIRVNEDTSDIKMPKPFVVTITDIGGTYSADKTYNEIKDAINNGYEVMAFFNGMTYASVGIFTNVVGFMMLQSLSTYQDATCDFITISMVNKVTIQGIRIANLPRAMSTQAFKILHVSATGAYALTNDNTILDTSTNTTRTWSGKKVNDELTARDNVIATKANASDVESALARKANTSDVNTALATKADKADTYTKSQVDTALSAKADTEDVTASLALKADKEDTYTKAQVDNIISNLPEPMIFKGTLGVNGTISDLPGASSDNDGYTYKVITDGTYQGIAAKVGDVFTSNAVEWVLIPSGDDVEDTWRTIKVNGTEVLNSAISSGAVDFIEGDNIEVIFNSTGNTILIKTKNIYNKTEINNALSEKADTTDVNTALNLKADKSDTYTKAEVNNALSAKADTDGTYEDMTVGTAMKLVATRHTTDTAPYLFRQSGGDNNAYVGTEETDKLVGASAVVNQMVKNGNFANTSNWTAINSSLSVANNEATVTVTDTSLASEIRTVVTNRKGHKYFRSAEVKASQGQFAFSWYGGLALTINANGNYQTISDIFESPSNDSDNWRLQLGVKADNSPSEFFAKNIILIDLTAMFGTAIADYVYSLEQATAGSGIAYLRKYGFFTKDYYPYTANSLQSVNTSAHITQSANRWDEEWEQGTFDSSTGEKKPYPNYWRSKNLIAVLPNTTYYAATSNDNIYRFYYDISGNYIGSANGVSNQTFTTPNGAYYLNIVDVTRNSYDSSSTPVSINYPSTVTTYNPYIKHEYALPNIDLRGLYKLDASNNLYADGDTLDGDGTLTRKYGIVDMGDLVWVYNSNNSYFYASVAGRKTGSLNLLCSPYVTGTRTGQSNITDKMITSYSANSNIIIKDSAYTDTTLFTNAMSGVYLIYEKDEPTTETATGFTNPQSVDKYGTEEYTDERDFPLPVGHETDYPLDSEMALPVPPVTAGTYNLQLTVDASGNQTYSWAT